MSILFLITLICLFHFLAFEEEAPNRRLTVYHRVPQRRLRVDDAPLSKLSR